MSAYRKNIICDVDGVCADLLTPWLARYHADHNHLLTPFDITDWDISRFVKPECGSGIFQYLHDKSLYNEVLPIAGALDGIQMLREMDYRVIFATSTNFHQAGSKLRWLADHGFLKLSYGTISDDYVEIKDKSLLAGSSFAIIDDYAKNLKDFEHPVLFAQFHNHLGGTHVNPSSRRVENWSDVVHYFRCITP